MITPIITKMRLRPKSGRISPLAAAGARVAAIIMALTAFPLAAVETIDSICAVVDEEIILESDISYGINSLLLERGLRYPTPEQAGEFRRQVLDAYINQKIMLAQAVRDSIVVEDRNVDRELER